jgi:hypothetical protein
MLSLAPTWTALGSVRMDGFASSSVASVIPWICAMVEIVSPDFTVWIMNASIMSGFPFVPRVPVDVPPGTDE